MKILISSLILLLFCGCAPKEKIVYKDVYMPIKCAQTMPAKPANKGDFASHKAIMGYYLECESLLKFCIGETK